jgi:hypothetical protein
LMEFNVKGANTARFRAEKLKNQLAAAWTEWAWQWISANFWGFHNGLGNPGGGVGVGWCAFSLLADHRNAM